MSAGTHASAASLIDLLHPDGAAHTVAVLGDACPSYLCDPLTRNLTDGTGKASAVLIAPDPRQCRTPGWLDDAADTAARLLGTDGIAYLVIGPRWRRRVVQSLRARGLTMCTAFAHARQGSSSDYLIPCESDVASYVSDSVLMNRRTQRLWRLGWSVPGASSLVPRVVGDIGVLARRAGARPHTAWMDALCAPGSEVASSLIRIKARGDSVTAVITLFAPGAETPHTILKVPLSEPSARARRAEAAILGRLGASARESGVSVPLASMSSPPGRHGVLRLDVLSGSPLSSVLVAQPQLFDPTLDRLAAWLERWSLSTRYERCLDRHRLEREIFRPAAAVAAALTDGEAYLQHLHAIGERCLGSCLPTVAIHGDLSMSNVLSDADLGLGIVDWENARADGLPLTDFFYAAADAAAAAGGYRDRTAAFIACLEPGTAEGRRVTAFAHRLASVLGIGSETVALLQHATVLHHAANEQRTGSSRHRPFLTVTQHLCTRAVNHHVTP